MKDTYTNANQNDFRQRYRKTIGKYLRPGKDPLWVYISESNEDGVTFSGLDGNNCFANIDSGVEFEFTQVPLGWYNSSEGPLFFSRKPAKQYQRGISANNTIVMNSNGKTSTPSLKLVSDVFTYTKPWDGTWPWALNRFFVITKNNMVYFLTHIIGELDNTTIKVNKGCSVVQELKDVLRKNNLQFSIEEEE